MEHMILPHQHGQSKEALFLHMPENEQFQKLASVFKILGDFTRLRIFWILCHCEECVINISAIMGMSSPAVAHHLKILKDMELVSTRRDGKETYYTASDTTKAQTLHHMIEALMEISCF